MSETLATFFTRVDLGVLAVTFLPLLLAQVALGIPRAAAWIEAALRARARAWAWCGGGVAALFLLAGLAVGNFDPYATAIVAAGTLAVLGVLRVVPRGTASLTAADAAAWLLLWIPFDLRWATALWQGPRDIAYNWLAVAVSVLAVVGWGVVRGLPGLGYRLLPTRRDVSSAFLALLGLAATCIPLGLIVGFLHFPPTRSPRWEMLPLQFVGLVLTVAIPEELFFRGILENGLRRTLSAPRLAAPLASLAFGLMHWNNAPDTRARVIYCSLATVAGLFYGWAYRRSGSLASAILVHALVDLLWDAALR
ncbi:MAG: CPBP family intramembrane metalloprotease [Planctomycetes bacterium]|nr:CPBP family intramembrane metalloprotease [Planctomycetota bacterium]